VRHHLYQPPYFVVATKWKHEMGCVYGMRQAEGKWLQLFGWKETYRNK